MSAVVKPPMPPPTMMTFIAQLTNQRANSRRIMVRKVHRVQRFSRDVVDGAPAAAAIYLQALYKSPPPAARAAAGAARGGRTRPPLASRGSVVGAEPPVPRAQHQPRKLRLADVNQRRVIAAFEIDVGLLLDAVVDDHVEIVAFADGGNRAQRAVRKQPLDLAFVGQSDVIANLLPQVR